jgi:hypothetical protein
MNGNNNIGIDHYTEMDESQKLKILKQINNNRDIQSKKEPFNPNLYVTTPTVLRLNQNINKSQPHLSEFMNANNYDELSDNINLNNNGQNQYQQQQQHEYYSDQYNNNRIRNEHPIYVPPFLINKNKPLRRGDHNAPQDYLPWSIVNIFLCIIIALPALFFSIQTRDMKRANNIKKAKMNSKRSLILNITASVIGLLTICSALILRFALYQLFVQNDVRSQNVPLTGGG